MTDARFQNGQQPQQQPQFQPSQPAPSGNRWRGILAGVASLGKTGAILVFLGGAAVLTGEAVFDEYHELRPANMYAALVGDARAGVEDRLREIAVKWSLIERDGTERITRETIAFTKEIDVRAMDVEERIKAVDRHQLPGLIGNITGEILCAGKHIEAGRMAGRCAETEQLRSDLMEERDKLIGPVQILQSDQELLGSMGLSADFMDQFK